MIAVVVHHRYRPLSHALLHEQRTPYSLGELQVLGVHMQWLVDRRASIEALLIDAVVMAVVGAVSLGICMFIPRMRGCLLITLIFPQALCQTVFL